MSDWDWVTLDKLGKLEPGKRMPNGQVYSPMISLNGYIPFINVSTVNKTRLYVFKCDKYLNKRGLSFSKLFPKNTVCITYSGTTGDSALLKNDSTLSWSLYGFSSTSKISDPKFVKYCFNFQYLKNKLISLSKLNTVQPNLTITRLLKVKFPKPPLEIQQKIGEILSKYDLILDNHEKQVKLLKELKKSLFREWFVKLRFPDYEKYSIENEIPEGWKKIKFGDLTKIQIGRKPASHANLLDGKGKYPFFTCSIKTKKSYTFSYDFPSLLVSAGGGYHCKFYDGKFEASTHILVSKLKFRQFSYLILEALNLIHLPKLQKFTFSVAIKNLSPQKLKKIEILIPDQKILEKFNNFWKNIHSKIEKLEQKMESYEKIKKNLLDSLFSQKIKVY